MPFNTFYDLLVDQVQILYAAERHTADVMQRMAGVADSDQLSNEFRSDSVTADVHAERLESVFLSLGESPRARETRRLRGLLEDCIHTANERMEPHLRDAAMIAVVQSLVHGEIAGYGCARIWARLLGHDTAASMLSRTLEEDKAADRRYTRLSETINAEAMAVTA